MQDELASDELMQPGRQQEVIGLHCAGLEEQIKSAPTRLQAERVLADACEGFDRVCESSILRTFLKQYVHRLFLRYWSP